MPHWELGWPASAGAAICLAAFAVLTRRRRGWLRPAASELALVLGLFALWQLAGQLALTRVAGAAARGRWIWHAERVLHLPSELSVQHAVLPHPVLVQALNGYYLYAHLNAMMVFLVWLFVRHRDRYRAARNTVVLLTGAALLVQLMPVAPPRLLGELGFVDTALRYGQSVYGAMGAGIADQLSAMPSLHVGWAVLIAVVVVAVSPSRWRYLVLLHPVLTIVVVVATANHFWLDAIAAVGLLGVALLAQRLGAPLGDRWRCAQRDRQLLAQRARRDDEVQRRHQAEHDQRESHREAAGRHPAHPDAQHDTEQEDKPADSGIQLGTDLGHDVLLAATGPVRLDDRGRSAT